MRVSPRALSARTRFDPMKPAAPVTTTYMSSPSLLGFRERREQLARLHDRGAELADHDAARAVCDRHRVPQRGPGAKHDPQRGDHRVAGAAQDRKSTRLNSSHLGISYAVFCLKKKKDTKRWHKPHGPVRFK